MSRLICVTLIVSAIMLAGCHGGSTPSNSASTGAKPRARAAAETTSPAKIDFACHYNIQDRKTGESLSVSLLEPAVKINDLTRQGSHASAQVARTSTYGIFLERLDGGQTVSLRVRNLTNGQTLADTRASFQSAHILTSRVAGGASFRAQCDQGVDEKGKLQEQFIQPVGDANFDCVLFTQNAAGKWKVHGQKQFFAKARPTETVHLASIDGLRIEMIPATGSTMQIYIFEGSKILGHGEAFRASQYVDFAVGGQENFSDYETLYGYGAVRARCQWSL